MSENIEKIKEENITEEVIEVATEESAEVSDKEYSEFEKICIKRGWNPEGELNAIDWDDNGWKLKNKKLDSLFQTVESLKDKLIRQEQESYKKALAQLEAEKVEAIEMADVKKVKEIEDKTKSLMDPSVKEHAEAFIMKHKAWFEGSSFRDKEMQLICKDKDKELMIERLPLKEHFQKLEEYMIEKYPDYFNPEPELPPSIVEGKQPVSIKSKKSKLTWDDLNSFQKQAAMDLKERRGIAIEDYIKRLDELNNKK